MKNHRHPSLPSEKKFQYPCFLRNNFKSRIWILVFLFSGLLVLLPSASYSWSIPDTGQTKCYNNTSEIPCPSPGEDFYGQDAQYQPQHPRSYTKLGLNGVELEDDALPSDQGGPWLMTRDNVTGLIWEIKQNNDGAENYANPHDADNTYTWYDSNPETNGGNAGTPGNGSTTFDTEQFITALNVANFGGFNDWRMPTVKELSSLVNRGVYMPAIDNGWFPGTLSSWYWSSTTHANYTDEAWVVGFRFGYDGGGGGYDDHPGDKYGSTYVRAVRGGQSGLFDDSMIPGRMVDNEDGTVTDTLAGLMWQQATAPGTHTWEQVLAYAEGAETAGYDGWRLPNQNELKTLVDYTRYNPAIDPVAFPGTAASWYWSSTTDAHDPSGTWVVYFYSGHDDGYYKSHSTHVRVVRGGQFGSLGHLVIFSPRQAYQWDIGTSVPISWDIRRLGANVNIFLSRQGGRVGSFETIIENIPNDGQYHWTVTGPLSVNCVIKIEQADDPAQWATAGMFVISITKGDINGDGFVDLADGILALQILAGIDPDQPIYSAADVNGDDKIGMEEVVHVLQTVSGVR